MRVGDCGDQVADRPPIAAHVVGGVHGDAVPPLHIELTLELLIVDDYRVSDLARAVAVCRTNDRPIRMASLHCEIQHSSRLLSPHHLGVLLLGFAEVSPALVPQRIRES